jgi:hypothetical protein
MVSACAGALPCKSLTWKVGEKSTLIYTYFQMMRAGREVYLERDVEMLDDEAKEELERLNRLARSDRGTHETPWSRGLHLGRTFISMGITISRAKIWASTQRKNYRKYLDSPRQ